MLYGWTCIQNMNPFALFLPSLPTSALFTLPLCVCMQGWAALCWAKLGYTIRMPHFPLWEWGKSRTLIILYIASCNHRPVESRRAVWGKRLIQYRWIINGELISMFGLEKGTEREWGKGEMNNSDFDFFTWLCGLANKGFINLIMRFLLKNLYGCKRYEQSWRMKIEEQIRHQQPAQISTALKPFQEKFWRCYCRTYEWAVRIFPAPNPLSVFHLPPSPHHLSPTLWHLPSA